MSNPIDAGGAWFRIEWVDETGSTNADLLAAAQRGERAGAVLVADYQSGGRGRRGRTWEAAPGSSLLFSVLVRPELRPDEAHVVTTALALGAIEACGSVVGVSPGLKWPNDLVVGERKLAGVLAESVVAGDRMEALVVGMGMNVRPGAAPLEVADGAVSLAEMVEGDEDVDRQELLVAILERFGLWLTQAETAVGRRELIEAARQASATLGRRVSVDRNEGQLEGGAVDLDDTGALIIDDGSLLHRVVVGDVIHLRTL